MYPRFLNKQSILALKVLTVLEWITDSGKLFHSLITLIEKNTAGVSAGFALPVIWLPSGTSAGYVTATMSSVRSATVIAVWTDPTLT